MHLNLQLYTEQYDFACAPNHFIALVGGVGSGKSIAGALRAIYFASNKIDHLHLVVPNTGIVTAPTYNILRDATIPAFKEVAGDLIAHMTTAPPINALLINGSLIMFRSAHEPELLRGPSITWWWGDEAALYTRDVWRIMIGRLRQHHRLGYAWLTTTPKGRNWLYQTFVQKPQLALATSSVGAQHTAPALSPPLNAVDAGSAGQGGEVSASPLQYPGEGQGQVPPVGAQQVAPTSSLGELGDLAVQNAYSPLQYSGEGLGEGTPNAEKSIPVGAQYVAPSVGGEATPLSTQHSVLSTSLLTVPKYALLRARTDNNPFIDADYHATLRDSYAGDFARQELDAEFIAFDGLIYTEFARDTHIRPLTSVGAPETVGTTPVTEGNAFRPVSAVGLGGEVNSSLMTHHSSLKNVIAGVDWGYANAGVILIFGVDGDGRLWGLHEEYARRRRIEEWAALAAQLQAQFNVETFFCDPAAPDFITQFQAAGVNAVPATNAVLPGIQAVKNRLVVQGDGLPRLIFSPAFVHTATEFEQYQWLQNHDGQSVRETPKKVDDHCVDCVRYVCMGVDTTYLPGAMSYSD